MKNQTDCKRKEGVSPLNAIPIGICMGVCYGFVFRRMALGISAGVLVGGAVAAALSRKKGPDVSHPEKIENQSAEQR